MIMPPVAILAGGMATRLQPITHTIPKSLVPIAGEPFLAYQLRLLKRRGVDRVVLLVGHLGEQIKDFAQDGSAFGLRIDYVFDGDVRRGTGGAVRAALHSLEELFFVTYGDSYLDIPLELLLRARGTTGCPVVMAVLHNCDRWDPSNVVFDGTIVRQHDKVAHGAPGVEWIDYGLSLFERDIFLNWPEPDPFDLSALTGQLAAAGRLAGVEATTRFYEIGKPEGLRETEAYLQSKGE